MDHRSPSLLGSPGLRAKFVRPRLPAAYVARPRLLRLLDRGLERRLTLVSAPAGFGKTTLISAWAAYTSWPVAWLTLSDAERDPVTFLDALVASVRMIAPDFGDGVLAMRRMADLPDVADIADALASDLADLPEAVTLVLDDGHRLDDSPAQQILAELVRMLPDDTRLIL